MLFARIKLHYSLKSNIDHVVHQTNVNMRTIVQVKSEGFSARAEPGLLE
jgi:hypothetical protein